MFYVPMVNIDFYIDLCCDWIWETLFYRNCAQENSMRELRNITCVYILNKQSRNENDEGEKQNMKGK